MPSDPSPLAATSLDELLRQRARLHGDRTLYTFLKDGEQVSETCTYAQLDQRAQAIAAWLSEHQQVGKAVLLVMPEGIDYVAAFFGCLYAGAIATPVNPPRRNRQQSRLVGVVQNSGAECVLTASSILELQQQTIDETPELSRLLWGTVDTLPQVARGADFRPRQPDQPAFLQYTSGSTGSPKGVVVTHQNLMENQRLIGRAFGQDESIIVAGWLPIYHDMGLIGNVLHPLYLGGQLVFMPPMAFLQKPIRWLKVISDYQATIGGGPDFAYDLLVRETTAQERAGLDLSAWQVAFNGSEPLHAATLTRFSDAFAKQGFRQQSFAPCYGMAETTLLVSGSRKTSEPQLATVDRQALANGDFLPAKETDVSNTPTSATQQLVGCGPPDEAVRLEIVHPDSQQVCEEGQVGEIWIAGDTVAAGYWNQPELSEASFEAIIAGEPNGPRFLRTGDLGVVHLGELFITGRIKDLIIVHGSNHYPQDIERTAQASHESLVPGSGAAFSTDHPTGEQVHLVQEVQRDWMRRLPEEEVFQQIHQAVLDQHQLPLASITLIRPASLPKTSSGKIQRQAAKQTWQNDDLKVVAQWSGDQPIGKSPADSRNVVPQETTSQASATTTALQAWIVQRIADMTRRSENQIDPRLPFASFGLGSLEAVRLSGRLSEYLGREVPPTLAYDYPTPAAAAKYLSEGSTKLETLPQAIAADEPLAVVGLGCRFPGGETLADYWHLLNQSKVGLSPFPIDRWANGAFQDASEDNHPPQGGFLKRVDQFDPTFFGISPREADALDPQQRLLLEIAWETFEHAGINPEAFAEETLAKPTGVFVGISSGDYSRLQAEQAAKPSPYSAIGGSMAVVANRLSYTFNLCGPSLTVDTACSSSLVAIHQAAAALRRGECQAALAGGVNLILSDAPTESLAGAGMLSPEGLCRTFATGANGFVRGEGCGLVLLKRLSDAQSDGDRILALLRGTAINQDGRSNGLTAPNGPSQQAVVRHALAQSQLTPDAIDYVEAHGTGTELGDPTEVGALGEVFGDRSEPLLLGSVKTNIGHLEGAAGVAGLIKTILALHHETLPAHLHFDANATEGATAPSPHIDWSLPIKVPTESTPWKRTEGHIRRAGVSSFGFGGTNAHVIVEEAPAQAASRIEDQPRWVNLSAKSPTALANLARQTAETISASDSLEAIAYATNVGRASHSERLAVHATSTEELIERLQSLDESARWQKQGTVHRPASCGWLFGGQGGCRPEMGKALYEALPTFQEAWDECDAVVQQHWPRSLSEIAWQSPDLLEGVDAQPVLVAWQISIARLWKSWLGMPSWVLGHSLGEYAAAVTAEAISLEDALRLVCRRAELLDTLTERGQMLAIMAPFEQVKPLLNADVSLAANNGPRQTVVSGSDAAIADLIEKLPTKTRSQRLATSHAFHSRLLDPVMDEFTKASRSVAFSSPRCGWISTLTGEAVEATLPTDYWAQQLRGPVEFAKATEQVGESLAVELSPTPVLASFAKQQVVAACSPRESEAESCQTAAAELWTKGVAVDYRQLHPRQTISVDLPTYPFERKRHWFMPGVRRSLGKTVHPLLGERLDLSGDRIVYQVDLATQPWLEDHRLEQTPTLPATAYIEMALAAAGLIESDSIWQLNDLQLKRPVQWQPGASCQVQTTLSPTENGYAIQFAHKADNWNIVAETTLRPADEAATTVDRIDETKLSPRSVDEHYRQLASVGLNYGPAFQRLKAIQADGTTALAQLKSDGNDQAFRLHPALTDAALQTIAQVVDEAPHAWVPAGVKSVSISKPVASANAIVSEVTLLEVTTPQRIEADIVLRSDDQIIAHLRGLSLRPLRLSSTSGHAPTHFQTVWEPCIRTRERGPAPNAMASDLGNAIFDSTINSRIERGLLSLAEHTHAQQHLESLSGQAVVMAIATLAQEADVQLGDVHTAAGLQQRLKIDAGKQRLFGRLLAIAVEEGLFSNIKADGANKSSSQDSVSYRLVKSPATLPANLAPASDCERQVRPEAVLLRRCAGSLAEVLRGEVDPLTLLFPSEGSGAAELYRESSGLRALNRSVAHTVAELVGQLPAGRSLRVLEIGAGTGATTDQLLEQCSLDRMEYVFTDVAPGFLAAARRRFVPHANLKFQTLDVEQPVEPQGFELGSFDVVIAANVLHATADLKASLQHATQLLRSGGQLLMVEGVRPLRWLDLTFGITDGWWRFADHSLRSNHPLLAPSKWGSLLSELGYQDFYAGSPLGHANVEDAENCVMIATAPDKVTKLSPKRPVALLNLSSEMKPAIESACQELGFKLDDSASLHAYFSISDDQGVESTLTESVALLGLLQELQQRDGVTQKILLVSNGQPTGTALWSLLKAAMQEHPVWLCRHAMADPASREFARAVAEELADFSEDEPESSSNESEVRLDRSGRHAARLVSAEVCTGVKKQGRRLTIRERGSIENLECPLVDRQPPEGNEIEIRICASGLNFRDVLNTLGQYPGEPPLGAECVGIVEQVGLGTTRFKPGDRVLAIAADSFAEFVTISETAAILLPEEIPWEEAATLPVAYATASVALEELATGKSEKKKQRVLIHAATGGVGAAAVQLAQELGHEIHATASSAKQHHLRSLGIDFIYDSRTNDFGDQILDATSGRGVDVIVNALGEDRLDANLKALAPDGIYVDLTKPTSDVSPRIRERHPQAAYHLVDLAADFTNHPERIAKRLQPLVDRVAQGELPPLPYQRFTLDQAADAFRLMQRAGHIGKIVISPASAEASALETSASKQLTPEGVYLITGGLGDLGLLSAKLLVEQGARKIALLGRSKPSPKAIKAIQSLTSNGTSVETYQVEISDRDQLDQTLNQVRKELGPLRGVIHSAGTLDDALLEDQNVNRFRTVFSGKAIGAWHLDQLTRDDKLDLFVVYSSVASVFGAPGQSNHSTANGYLDGLIAKRRQEGLPGLSINWGPWSQLGEAARRDVDQRSDLGGIQPLTPDAGAEFMQQALLRYDGQLTIAPWQVSQAPSHVRAMAFFSRLFTGGSRTRTEGSFLVRLKSSPAFKHRELLLGHLRSELAAVLGMADGSSIAPDQAMFDLGLDSLTTLELKNSLHRSLGIDLPSSLLFDYPTLDGLTDAVLKRLALDSEKSVDKSAAPPTSQASEAGRLATASTETTSNIEPDESSVLGDLAALEAELETWDATP